MSNSDFILQLEKEEKRLLGLLDAVQKLKSAYNLNNSEIKASVVSESVQEEVNKSFEASDKGYFIDFSGQYDPNWDWQEKVVFILYNLKEATSEQVAEKLHKHEPEVDFNKCLDVARQLCSSLKRSGKINYRRRGRGFIYMWK